jgi:hypothetical protein
MCMHMHMHMSMCMSMCMCMHMQCTCGACPVHAPPLAPSYPPTAYTHLGGGLPCVLAVEVEAIEGAHELRHPHRLGIVELAWRRDRTRELLQ